MLYEVITFDALYCETREEAVERAMAFVAPGATVGFGGSMTVSVITSYSIHYTKLYDGKEGWFFGSFVHNLYDGPNGNPPPWPNVPDW